MLSIASTPGAPTSAPSIPGNASSAATCESGTTLTTCAMDPNQNVCLGMMRAGSVQVALPMLVPDPER